MADLQFTPKKEEELSMLLKEGQGTFEVMQATHEISKSGNPMIKLLLKCWDCTGSQANIFEYLILNDNVFSHRKIRHFCYSVGLETQYENGSLNASDCEHKFGDLIIGIQKDKSGTYPDKNCVIDFLKNDPSKSKSISKELDDDLPF